MPVAMAMRWLNDAANGQNVSDEARVWRIKPDLKLGAPSLVERLELPDLTDSTP